MDGTWGRVVLYRFDMYFLISSELQGNEVAFALRHSLLKISQNAAGPYNEDCIQWNWKRKAVVPFILLISFTNDNILLLEGSIPNLQSCVNMVYYAVNIRHALSYVEMIELTNILQAYYTESSIFFYRFSGFKNPLPCHP